jgi:hypothetical protein
MSTVIESWAGDENRDAYWIEKKVLRLGSGADCDLRVDDPAVPKHLATVRFRNGQYVLYNRSGKELQIADRRVAPNGSATWHANEELVLTADTTLRLIVDGSPDPVPQPDNEVFQTIQARRNEERRLKSVQETEAIEEATDEKTNAANSTLSPQTLIGIFLLGLAALAVLALAAFWFLEPGAASTKSSFNPARVVKNLLPYSSELPPRLVTLMQEAQQSVELGDPELGKMRLHRLLSELNTMKAGSENLSITQNGNEVDYEKALRAYINHYLAQLD